MLILKEKKALVNKFIAPVQVHLLLERDLVDKIDIKVCEMNNRGNKINRSDIIRTCIAMYIV